MALYDLASVFADQIRTAESEAGRIYEAVIGIVTDNKDPSKLGRVKVKIVAKSAELKAGQNLEIHAGSSMAWGTNASATIKSSSSVTISGSKANMNCGNASAPPAPSANPKAVDDPYKS
jgi:hypothetical protein